jgi:hypothetical protein
LKFIVASEAGLLDPASKRCAFSCERADTFTIAFDQAALGLRAAAQFLRSAHVRAAARLLVLEGTAFALLRVFAHLQEIHMGKYFLAWILGVPAFVLVILYLFFH